MKNYTYILTVIPPVRATDEEIKRWVDFEITKSGIMPDSNPLSEYELSYENCSVRDF